MVLLDLDPNLVKPGWTPLLITIAIGAVLVLLYLSMRRQFNRIDVSQAQPGVTDAKAYDATGSPGETRDADSGESPNPST